MELSFDQRPADVFTLLRGINVSAEAPMRIFRTSQITQGGEVLLSIDSQFNYLLVPVSAEPDDYVLATPKGFKTGFLQFNLGEEASGAYFFVAALNRSVDLELFSLFLDKALGKFAGNVEIEVAVAETLDAWREMLKINESKIPIRTLTGLFGELTVVHGLVANALPLSLDFWRGPQMARTDFYFDSFRIEVKTSASQGARKATISSLQQLDDSPNFDLFLLHLQMEWDPAGHSILDLVTEIKGLAPNCAGELDRKIQLLGFEKDDLLLYEHLRWSKHRFSLYRVDADFPRLTPVVIENYVPSYHLVEGVSYRINLESLEFTDLTENLGHKLARIGETNG